MAPTREAWAAAFAHQAQSDWTVYERLAGDLHTPRCHSLHYLQMACEKIAKAYRCRDTTAALDSLMSRHSGFRKLIEVLLKSPFVKRSYRGHEAQREQIARDARKLAALVETLAPALGREQSPDNAEYPWAVGDAVVTPCTYGFPNLSMLKDPGGRTFLKLVSRAIRDFDKIETY